MIAEDMAWGKEHSGRGGHTGAELQMLAAMDGIRMLGKWEMKTQLRLS